MRIFLYLLFSHYGKKKIADNGRSFGKCPRQAERMNLQRELTKKNGYETVVLSKEYADGSLHILNAVLKNNVLEIYTAYVWNRDKTEKRRLAYGNRETGSNSAIPPQ
jgi:hypothetical protein